MSKIVIINETESNLSKEVAGLINRQTEVTAARTALDLVVKTSLSTSACNLEVYIAAAQELKTEYLTNNNKLSDLRDALKREVGSKK